MIMGATFHTDNKAFKCHAMNVELDGHPPSISNSERDLTRKECLTLAHLRSGLLQEQNQEGCTPQHLWNDTT